MNRLSVAVHDRLATRSTATSVRYPLGLALYVRGSELVSDACFLALGIVAASKLPPASVISAFGELRWAWVILMICGSALTLVGTVASWDGPKMFGLCLSGTAIMTWCAAILQYGHTANGPVLVILAFTGTVALLSYRLGAHFALVYLRQLRG